MLKLESCPKHYTLDQDKALSPSETVKKVKERLALLNMDILSDVRRIDNGRLDIPVFLSVAGSSARIFMPTRKQMGKGATRDQAEASAIMELMERYGFFTFWQINKAAFEGTWSEAKKYFGNELIPLSEILKSVGENSGEKEAETALNLLNWKFYPALEVASGKTVYAPLDWFKKLSEFNGSSAGNTDTESVLQGACELVERHVCCVIDSQNLPVPSIEISNIEDPILKGLLERFKANGINVLLKDFSLDMPVPTVAAIAYDPATFPEQSEIVYTAGTAASPDKAAIRALTEVAQLAGDFNSGACYEASGLPKYSSIEDLAWLQKGDRVALESLPSILGDDFLNELKQLAGGLKEKGYNLYTLSTTNPDTQVPSNYSFVPGFRFRERDKNASIGMFVGRILVEEKPDHLAQAGLKVLEKLYPNAHYLPFFKGLLAMNMGDIDTALYLFTKAEPLQPENDSKGLAAFYYAYVLTSLDEWEAALPALDRAVQYCPEMKEYFNLRGVANYKLGNYAKAAENFEYIVKHLDKGSVMNIANLGVCNKFLGNKEKAAHYLVAALELEPALEFAKKHLEELISE